MKSDSTFCVQRLKRRRRASQRGRRRTSLPWRARRSISTSARLVSRRNSLIRSAYRGAVAGRALQEVRHSSNITQLPVMAVFHAMNALVHHRVVPVALVPMELRLPAAS